MQRILCIFSVLVLVWQAAMAPTQRTGANTPSYEDMLQAVKAGTFEVQGAPKTELDPKTELEELLARSKLL